MTLRRGMTALRDWTALACAVAMVGFLTFVPQHAPAGAPAEAAASHPPPTDWPSRRAEVARGGSVLR